MLSVNQVRSSFLEYFKGNKHEVVTSSALVPHNDPTLMFTNAGMVQFKDVFTQKETRSYNRATSSQKCVRAGGKHNDLDNVGYTARHHTFFEMLGNFSFGDYFKEDAIPFAWNFLTKEVGLSPEKLLVTIYHDDEEAYRIWKKVTGFSDDKIIRIATSDNFWSMGETGPCGPCSEIFYDHGENIPGGPPGSPDEDGDRFIEIWNLVFMQYEMLASGERIDLPAPSIDTGMGLERMAAVLQGVHDNYDIDLFQTLIAASQDITKNASEEHLVSHRVIADHLRSMSFLMADGVMPSNEGRGYVLRRIMRRAMRHARQLGCKEPVIYKMVPTLVSEMSDAFPELSRAKSLVEEIIKLEEERFGETLGRGLKLLDEEISSLGSNKVFSGEVAFKLYDTYGFPLDLTVDILRGKEISVDEAGFEESMKQQKERAKAAWKGSGESKTDEVWFEIKEAHGATEFLGYELEEAQAEIVALVSDGQIVDSVESGSDVSVILNQTPFYGESGGQEGDRGKLVLDTGEVLISDTQKYLDNLHVHTGKVVKGEIKSGSQATAYIDAERRLAIKQNHSATHILHAVLREVLGGHVTQKGSLVAEERLRFDISHPKAVTAEQLREVELKVNRIIRQNTSVGTRLMPQDAAIEAGAMALFGEKYGEEVRVVNMGVSDGVDYSVELCGGTHVERTGDIGILKIVSESAIAAGVRRIEALTGSAAFDYVLKQEQALADVASLLKVSADEAANRVQALVDERKQLEKALAEEKKKALLGGSQDVSSEVINGIEVVGKHFSGVAPKDLRNIVMELQQANQQAIIIGAGESDGKGSIIIAVPGELTDRISAVTLVNEAAPILGAKGGGGKANFAQTGGPEGAKSSDALEKVKAAIAAA
jgi:alanyl-tRNA synthetase